MTGVHTQTQSYNHMLTVFHFTIPLSIAQRSLRWLQAAILNLFSDTPILLLLLHDRRNFPLPHEDRAKG